MAWRFNLLLLGLTIVAIGALAREATAKAFYSKQEALALAFPDAEKVETKTFFLTDKQVLQISTLATAPLES
ncbi:MAG: FMN-binding protein, partial [Candidatus Binatia bacterium]